MLKNSVAWENKKERSFPMKHNSFFSNEKPLFAMIWCSIIGGTLLSFPIFYNIVLPVAKTKNLSGLETVRSFILPASVFSVVVLFLNYCFKLWQESTLKKFNDVEFPGSIYLKSLCSQLCFVFLFFLLFLFTIFVRSWTFVVADIIIFLAGIGRLSYIFMTCYIKTRSKIASIKISIACFDVWMVYWMVFA